MSLQYSNDITIRQFLLTRPEVKKPLKQSGRFSFYYTSPSYKIPLPVITQADPDKIQYFDWGLIPSWVKTREKAFAYRNKTLVAKSETVFALPSYRGYIRRKRCLIPATGFIEWHLKLGVKYPFFIQVKEDAHNDVARSFCFGGIYSTWIDEETAEVLNTFSMITTPGNEFMAFIHNSNKRMPLILSRESEQQWLKSELTDEEIMSLLKPYPNDLIKAHTISRRFIFKDAEPDAPETLMPFRYKNMDMHLGSE